MLKNINRKLATHDLASSRTAQSWQLLSLVAQNQGAHLAPHGTVAALHSTTRYGTAPLCMALHRTAFHYAALLYIALHCMNSTVSVRYGTAPQPTVRSSAAQHGTARHGTPTYSFTLTRFSSFLLYFRFMPSSQSAWLVL